MSREGMCIAGVFGGLHSGVTTTTKNIFLESACFDPVTIRKTSFRHGLRTDAATRFEKGTDISATVNVLKRAALMIKEIAVVKLLLRSWMFILNQSKRHKLLLNIIT